ncbi:MAG: SufS family cysteine desulfurase [Verrucomicrobiota bacterium]
MPKFDVKKLRDDFPILSREIAGKRLAYLDNGATSQKPREVIDRLSRFYLEENANIHRGVHYLSREATDAYDGARESIKNALGVPSTHELVFVRGATEAFNLVAHGLADNLERGDEIILTIFEHHANIVPWQVIESEKGIKLHFIGMTEEGALDLEAWKAAFSERTRVAAFTHVSNVLGTVNPIAEMIRFAKEHEVITVVDGAQALPHGPVNLSEATPDFYAFSGHKVYAPDGIGVLIGERNRLDRFPPYQTGGDMIEQVKVEGSTYRETPARFEAGTPAIAEAIALGEAFRYMAEIDWEGARAHERSLADHLSGELANWKGTRIFGRTEDKTAIVSFYTDWAHPHDVGTLLDTEGVAIRVGHHCAQPLMDHLGVPATARASFAFYNDESDVEAFFRGMDKVRRFLA